MAKVAHVAFEVARAWVRSIARICTWRSKHDYIIYKVDRIGDWILSQGSVVALVEELRTRGRGLLIVSEHVDPKFVRRYIDIDVRQVYFGNESIRAIAKNIIALIRLACSGRVPHFVSLRHSVSPLREMFIAAVNADKVACCNVIDATMARTYRWLRPTHHAAIRHDECNRVATARELALHEVVFRRVSGRTGVELRTKLPQRQKNYSIVICPFGSSDTRDYPAESWSIVLSALAMRLNRMEIGVLTRRACDPRLQAFLRQLDLGNGVRVTPIECHTLCDFVDTIGSSTIIVTVESAAAHIAAAYDMRGAVIIGGGHYGRYAPWGWSSRLAWITKHLDCFGCDWTCVRRGVECIQDIEPYEVVGRICEGQ